MSPHVHNATAPRIARHLLWRLLPADLREPVIGDFEELYTDLALRRGAAHAARWYWGQTLQSVLACLAGTLTEALGESWTSFLAACRTLLRERRSTIVSIAGLTVALAVAVFVAVHIGRELGFDAYHAKSDRVYRVAANLTLGGTPNAIASTNAALAPTMVESIPEVLTATRVRPLGKRAVRHADRLFYEERILLADEFFFDVFSFPFVQGGPAEALRRAGSVVVTERTANQYFGRDDPLGRGLTIGGEEYTVTGVMRNVPLNSHFVFDMLCSMPAPEEGGSGEGEAWLGPFVHYTYVVLRDRGMAHQVESKLRALVADVAGAELAADVATVDYFLQPLTVIHLGSHLRHELAPNGRGSYLGLLAAIAGAIVLLAGINLVNLARERWTARSREVGRRPERVRQFIAEALLFSLSALVLALGLVHMLFPWIGAWLATDHVAFAEGIASMSPDPDLHLAYASLPWLIPAFLALAVGIGLIAGCYPIVFGGKDNPGLRRLLLATQLAVSLVLLVAAAGVVRQTIHLETVQLGFDKHDVVVIPLVDADRDIGLATLEARLAEVPGVLSVGAGSHVPGQRPSGGAYLPEGYGDEHAAMMDRMSVDATYLDTLGIEITTGRGFSASDPALDTDTVLVNTAAVEAFDWQDPIGKTIRRSKVEGEMTVIGVVEDFHFSSAHRRIGPILIERRDRDLRSLVVKIDSRDVSGTQERLRAVFAALAPDRPFAATLLEPGYDRQFTAERNLGRLFALFAVLSVIITTLGLFGVAPLFGAGRFVARFRELVVLCVVANLVALPVAYVLLQRWLQSFPYRMTPGVGVFAIAALLMLAISFVALASTGRVAKGHHGYGAR